MTWFPAARRFGLFSVSVFALLLAAVGCGDDGKSPDDDTSSSSTGGQGGDGQGGIGEGGMGQGGSAGAELTAMWPLAAGNYWSYDVMALGTGGVCGPGMYSMQVQSEMVVDGRDAFMVTGWCSGGGGGTSPYAWDTNGDLLYYFGGQWQLTMANQLEDGATFMAFNLTYRWRPEGSVTVPAGTFNNCWSVEQVGKIFYSTYCEGVGPVRHFSDDGSGNGWDAQLMDTNAD